MNMIVILFGDISFKARINSCWLSTDYDFKGTPKLNSFYSQIAIILTERLPHARLTSKY